MPGIPIVCGECGLRLGLGDPGAWVSCVRCGCLTVARAQGGDPGGAIIGAAIAVGAGLIAAYALSRVFGRR